MTTSLLKQIGISLPLIQAPMAGGITSPELVAAVSNSGGLGSLGAGIMTADEIRDAIREIKKLTDKPFAVNLFTVENCTVTDEQQQKMCSILNSEFSEFNVKVEPQSKPYRVPFKEQFAVILEEKVPVFSFTFGIPEQHYINEIHEQGGKVLGTATSLAEAEALIDAKVDAIVAQGVEAGGHRGTFIGRARDSSEPLHELLEQLAQSEKIDVPIIAAGGIADAAAVKQALAKGAQAVQIGTLFVCSTESSAAPVYKERLINATEDNTVLTRAFSGRTARSINNTFVQKMESFAHDFLEFPVQNKLTQPIRKAAKERDDSEHMSLWAGQSVEKCQALDAKDIVELLTK